ncbi:MAG: molybdenum cofactor guanylyltransferase [Phycisphaeraceae bacterium]|nr:molybdenum cofactor guanylyltransferase [Phycisphaeraceae bacterium]
MITLAVLAGGQGRRMGGPKDRLLIDGRPVLEVLLERLAWPGRTMLVVAFGEAMPEGRRGFDVLARDAVPEQGPLRGVLTALLGAGGESVVAVPVDMPGLRRKHVEWVAKRLNEQPGAAGVMLRRPDGIEPFPCAFRPVAAAMIERRIESGQRAIHALAEEAGVLVVDAPRQWGAEVWRNVNEPHDLPSGWTRPGDLQSKRDAGN